MGLFSASLPHPPLSNVFSLAPSFTLRCGDVCHACAGYKIYSYLSTIGTMVRYIAMLILAKFYIFAITTFQHIVDAKIAIWLKSKERKIDKIDSDEIDVKIGHTNMQKLERFEVWHPLEHSDVFQGSSNPEIKPPPWWMGALFVYTLRMP